MEIVLLVFLGNLRQQDAQLLNLLYPFLIETIEYWSTLNYRHEEHKFQFYSNLAQLPDKD